MLSDSAILKKIERQPKRTAGFKQLVRELGLHGDAAPRTLRPPGTPGRQRPTRSGRFRPLRDSPGRRRQEHGRRQAQHASRRLRLRRSRSHVAQRAASKPSLSGDIFIPPPAVGSAMHGDRVLVEVGNDPSRRPRRRPHHSPRQPRPHHRGRHLPLRPAPQLRHPHRPEDLAGNRNPAGPGASRQRSAVPLCRLWRSSPNARQQSDPHRVLGEEAARRAELGRPRRRRRRRRNHRLAHRHPESPRQSRRDPRLRRRLRRRRRNHHSQIPSAPPLSRRSARRSASHRTASFRAAKSQRAATSAICPSSPSTAKPPATSTTPSPSASSTTATSNCRSTSPTSPTTSLPARRSISEARLRGTSVYFPDRAVPMLPLELSTDICSLRPQVDRLVLSCVMEIDHRGEIVGYELMRRHHPLRRAHDLHRRAAPSSKATPPCASVTRRWSARSS